MVVQFEMRMRVRKPWELERHGPCLFSGPPLEGDLDIAISLSNSFPDICVSYVWTYNSNKQPRRQHYGHQKYSLPDSHPQ